MAGVGGQTQKPLYHTLLSLGLSAAIMYFGTKYAIKKLTYDPHADDAKKKAKALERRLGNVAQFKNQHEQMIAADVVDPEDVKVTFDDIGGIAAIKQEIYDIVVLPLKRPELFGRSKLLQPPKGILLYGPPGVGKTMLAKAIAAESSCNFINLKMSTLMDKYFGESQKLVRAVFTVAERLSPAIIFIDEVDAFLRQRDNNDHQASAVMKAEFMSLWDGMLTETDHHVVVIAATNRPWDIDKAILRRLPRGFMFDLPSEEERKSILSVLMRDEKLGDDFDIDIIARSTEGYSGSDLKELCKCASLKCVQEFLKEEKKRGNASGSDRSSVDVSLPQLTTTALLEARRSVPPTGASAKEYLVQELAKHGGLNLS